MTEEVKAVAANIIADEFLEKLKEELKGQDQDLHYSAMRDGMGWKFLMRHIGMLMQTANTELIADGPHDPQEDAERRATIRAYGTVIAMVEYNADIHIKKVKEEQKEKENVES